jgi:GNAT superfamily N-acetyltransferase
MNIRAALPTEARALSDLAVRAKAHWGYPAQVLDMWRPELTVFPQDVRAKPTFVGVVDQEIVAFYSLVPSTTSWEIDNFWVLPQFMHRGIGRSLLLHALETAARGGAVEVTVDADPNAEPFYVKCGAVRRAEVAAPIPGLPSRTRPQLAFNLRAI